MSDEVLQHRVEALEREAERLRKMVEVLMNRVERSTDAAGSSYSLFESNILLQEKVKERTARLREANTDLQHQIEERRRTEEALRWERNFVDAVLEAAGALIIVLDSEGAIVRFNRACERVSGLTAAEVRSSRFSDLIPPDEIESVMELFDELRFGRPSNEGENHWVSKLGEARLIAWSNTVLFDEAGEVEYIVGIGIDITEVRRAEEKLKRAAEDLEQKNQDLRDTQTKLIQSEKMASLGNLVAGIAHEINTPIGSVRSMHDTLMRAIDKLHNVMEASPEAWSGDAKVQSLLKVINDANSVIKNGTERVTTIVRRLRSFARLDEAEAKDADLHEGLEDTLSLIHHEIKHNIEVVRNFGSIPRVSCYPGRLNQVFLNLLVNSRQAMREGKGTITITTFEKDGFVHIQFADTGSGIPKEKLDKIFDPGYTSKGVGVGTGLGLSICYQIMQDHHGEIRVESEEGKGATFTLVIPTNLDEILNIS